MKIQKLILHNIASIEDACIDFEQTALADAPLFLITGETGSGKTTLLDGICLALYAKTPRMTRVPSQEKYTISTTDREQVRQDEINVNDNSQLMRRNTGECFAELHYTGNDEQPYIASWHLQRANRRPTGKLQPQKRSLQNAKTQQVFTKKDEIEQLIADTVGLSYEQFVRTTLLAQGEFTRFLQSKSDEKSEILEKLTGTEIYSEIGQRIAAKNKAAEEQYRQLKLATANIRLLTAEEKAELEMLLAKCAEETKQLEQRMKLTSSKMEWLKAHKSLTDQRGQVREQLERTTARIQSDQHRENLRLLADYDLAQQAIGWLTDCRKAQAQLETIKGKKVLLNEKLQGAKAAVERTEKDLASIETKGKLKRQELTDLKPEETARQRDILHQRMLQLNELRNALKLLADRKENAALALKQEQETAGKLAEEQKKRSQVLPLLDPARAQQAEFQQLYDRMELSVRDTAKELRRLLKEGEPCPICGRRVEERVADAFFESQLEPLRQKLAEARKRVQDIDSTVKACQKNIENLQKAFNDCHKLTEKWHKAAESQEQLTRELIAKAGFSETDTALLPDCIGKEEAANKKEADRLNGIQQQINQCQAEINNLHQNYTNTQKALQKAKDGLARAEQEMRVWETQVSDTEKRIGEYTERVALFYDGHPHIDKERLVALSGYRADDINHRRTEADKLQQLYNRLKGQAEQLEKLLSEQEKQRPELAEEDTLEHLTEQMEACKQQQTTVQEQSGRSKGLLETDSLQQAKVAEAKAKEEEAHRIWDRWNGLAALFGDNAGKKFRNIAQSYLLSYLLKLANGYLQNFTDRYTLTCMPGSLLILVEDAYQSGTPQGANILSGGESFMVSLSLALALSRLNASHSGVDTLFIDEGFGTLSADCLSSVMDTLERLHQLGGRRVGIISHVEELSERIPVQIRVSRINPTQSRVDVVQQKE